MWGMRHGVEPRLHATATPREPLLGRQHKNQGHTLVEGDVREGGAQIPAPKWRLPAPSAGRKPRGEKDPTVNGAER